MKKILYTIFILFIISCNSADNETKVDKIQNKEVFPIIIDTLNLNVLDFLKNDTVNATWLSTAQYKFLYIGNLKDTIYIDHFLSYSPPPPPPPNSDGKKYDLPKYENKFGYHYIEWDAPTLIKNPKDSKIDIKINTENPTNNSYPVIVTNLDSDTTIIGYGEYLPLIMEALDSNGIWQPIEERFVYMCGNGVGTIILPPNEIVLTTAPIFNGDFSTKMRLHLYKSDIYSNSFDGKINYRQFESKYTKQGDYKEEYKTEIK